jgi:membrane fusion protein, multidrug efflux system
MFMTNFLNSGRRARSRRRHVVTTGLLLMCVACSRAPQTAAPPAKVTFVTVVAQERTVTNDYPAQIEASNTVEIRPRVGGLLLRQAALEGKVVRKGEVLFVVDPAPYQAALGAAKGDLAKTLAAFSVSKRNLVRSRSLAEQSLISKGDLDNATGTNEGNEAAVAAAQAAVDTAALNLSFTNVTSPIDGVVGRVQVRAGGVVVASQTLLTYVYSTKEMYVNFGVSEASLPQLSALLAPGAAHASDFKLILTGGSEYPLRGKIDFVDPAINAQTGTLPVRLRVANPDGALHSNQFARVVVPTQKIPDALTVPVRAVQEVQGKTYLWVIAEDGTAQQRDVKMGAQLGREEWLVDSGLKVGEKVIVDGSLRLKTGSHVQGTPLDAQPGATEARAQ